MPNFMGISSVAAGAVVVQVALRTSPAVARRYQVVVADDAGEDVEAPPRGVRMASA